MSEHRRPVLVIACGALARDLRAWLEQAGCTEIEFSCLPASLHNRPEWIPERVRHRIRTARSRYRKIFVAYGDCGTGGALDRVLAEEGVERLEGAHCYEFFAGPDLFAELSEAEPGSFFLTDYLVRQFDQLVIRGLGLDRHPELLPLYFGNYRRLVHLAQTDDPEFERKARRAAARLGLEYVRHFTGLGGLADFLRRAAGSVADGAADHSLLAGHSGPDPRAGGTEDGSPAALPPIPRSYRSRRDARRSERKRRLSRRLAAGTG